MLHIGPYLALEQNQITHEILCYLVSWLLSQLWMTVLYSFF